ncbi:MAG: addiction module protein [Pyrinomonadaceae bacterium]
MSKALEEITREAIQLPRQDRLALAERLLEIDDLVADPEVAMAWEDEILARIQAVDEGRATGISRDEVMREADSRLTS